MRSCCFVCFMIFFFSIYHNILRYLILHKLNGELHFLPQCIHKNTPEISDIFGLASDSHPILKKVKSPNKMTWNFHDH